MVNAFNCLLGICGPSHPPSPSEENTPLISSDNYDTSPLTLQDFLPGKWKTDRTETLVRDNQVLCKYIKDTTTNRLYRRKLKMMDSRYIFVGLALFGPVIQGIALSINVIFQSIKLLSLSHFWYCKEGEQPKSFTGKLEDAGCDLLKIFLAPIVFLGLELTAIYGIFSHHDGKKIYSSIERAQYTYFYVAPYFQPRTTMITTSVDSSVDGFMYELTDYNTNA